MNIVAKCLIYRNRRKTPSLCSLARQASAERAWSAIARFYDNCKKKVAGLKGFPKFQKDNRSVEYKTSGWRLADDRKSITFTDKKSIGKLKMKGTRDLNFYQPDQIKRVRLVKRADGYYVQFCIQADTEEVIQPTHKTIGLDVGLESFYTDPLGIKVENPRFYRTGEQKMRRHKDLFLAKSIFALYYCWCKPVMARRIIDRRTLVPNREAKAAPTRRGVSMIKCKVLPIP